MNCVCDGHLSCRQHHYYSLLLPHLSPWQLWCHLLPPSSSFPSLPPLDSDTFKTVWNILYMFIPTVRNKSTGCFCVWTSLTSPDLPVCPGGWLQSRRCWWCPPAVCWTPPWGQSSRRRSRRLREELPPHLQRSQRPGRRAPHRAGGAPTPQLLSPTSPSSVLWDWRADRLFMKSHSSICAVWIYLLLELKESHRQTDTICKINKLNSNVVKKTFVTIPLHLPGRWSFGSGSKLLVGCFNLFRSESNKSFMYSSGYIQGVI